MNEENKNTETTGAVAPLTPSPEIQRVPIECLRADATNIRQKYDEEGLKGLAKSLVEEGLIQNLECVPDGTVNVGNRRFKAITLYALPELRERYRELSGNAGDSSTPKMEALAARIDELARPMCRVISADEATRAKVRQTIENLQRENVTAYEEAVGYAFLLDLKDGEGKRLWTAESIAARIGKTNKYVWDRIKVKDAPAYLLDALAKGKVGARQCEIVARIPDKALREEAARRVVEPKLMDRCLTVVETADMVRQDYTVNLLGAPFDREDGELVPGAPKCSVCEFRTGNDKSLEGQISQGRVGGFSCDMCQNPACFRRKCDASWRFVVNGAERFGYGVLAPDVAAAEFSGPGGKLAPWSKYVDLAEKPTPKDVGHYDERKVKTWGEVLKDSGIRIIKARHPKTCLVHDLAEKPVVQAAVELKLEEARHQAAAKAAPPTGAEATPDLFTGTCSRPDLVSGARVTQFPAQTREEKEAAERAKAAAERAARKLERQVVHGMFDALGRRLSEAEWSHEAAELDWDVPSYEAGVRAAVLPSPVLEATLETLLRASAEACGLFSEWMELAAPHPGAGGRDFLPVIMEGIRSRQGGYSARELTSLIALAAVAPGAKFYGASDVDLQRLCLASGLEPKKLATQIRAKLEKDGAKGKKRKGKKAGEGAEELPLEDKPEMGQADIEMVGACEVNRHGVVLNAEVVVCTVPGAKNKAYRAELRVAELPEGFAWAYDFQAPNSGQSSPVKREGPFEASRWKALHAAAVKGLAFFGLGAPRALLDKLREHVMPELEAGEVKPGVLVNANLVGSGKTALANEAKKMGVRFGEVIAAVAQAGSESLKEFSKGSLALPAVEGLKANPGPNPKVLEANAAYEARLTSEAPAKMADVEVEFGLKKNQLRNFRANQQKQAAKDRATKGKGAGV